MSRYQLLLAWYKKLLKEEYKGSLIMQSIIAGAFAVGFTVAIKLYAVDRETLLDWVTGEEGLPLLSAICSFVFVVMQEDEIRSRLMSFIAFARQNSGSQNANDKFEKRLHKLTFSLIKHKLTEEANHTESRSE